MSTARRTSGPWRRPVSAVVSGNVSFLPLSLQNQQSCIAPVEVQTDIGKSFCAERVVKHWNAMPKEVVGFPSPGVFEGRVDMAPRDVV